MREKSIDGVTVQVSDPMLSLTSSLHRYETVGFRPLTGYPDGGTGEGFPLKLVDHIITRGGGGREEISTHLLKSSPEAYQLALFLALGHFDAEELVLAQGDRTLTPEERETLDGCKLLQGLILEEDRSLDRIRSFAAYEKNLTKKIIPTIHENFEELDEESTEVLAKFFMWHGAAVRFYTARETRKLLRVGGDDGGSQEHNVPVEESLQSYALKHALGQDAVDRVSLGLTKVEYVKEFEMMLAEY